MATAAKSTGRGGAANAKAPARGVAKGGAKAPARGAARGGAKAGDRAASSTVSWRTMVAEMAETHGMTKKAAGAFVDEAIERTVKHLKKGAKVRIGGLGILQVKSRAARMGRNPKTGESIKIKASKKVSFRALKELKEAI